MDFESEQPPASGESDDWAAFTNSAKAALLAALVERLDIYQQSMAALGGIVRAAQTAVTESTKRTTQIHRKLAHALDTDSAEVDLDDAEDSSEEQIEVEFTQEEAELLARIVGQEANRQGLMPPMIREMAWIYAVALFEGLVADVYAMVMRFVPGRLRLDKQITYADALAFETRTDLISELAQRATRGFTNQTLDDQLRYLKRTYDIDVPADSRVTVKDLVRILSVRHLFVHNSGIVSRDYAAATGSRTPIGNREVITDEEFKSATSALGKTGTAIVDGLARNLCQPAASHLGPAPVSTAIIKRELAGEDGARH
jgi:hypothetical protein